jgi:hypothetical protein
MNKHCVGSLREILSTRAKMKFDRRINFENISPERYGLMKQWCDENCQGFWNSNSTYAVYFQFENDRDAMMFALKWAS